LTTEAKGLLASKYVCVYVNTDTEDGQRLAKSFEMTNGIVISDRTGDLQAFRHEGGLTGAELVRNLERYAAPERQVRVTETTGTQRTSYYAPDAGASPAGYAAPGYAPAGYGAPGYCPSCSSCANGRCRR
jgi:hypothetical protein